MLDYGRVFEQLPPYVAMNLLAHEGCTARIFMDCGCACRAPPK
jgi:hypothetical protein